jgi:hypothetical protein
VTAARNVSGSKTLKIVRTQLTRRPETSGV